jgi:hypothetical protein
MNNIVALGSTRDKAQVMGWEDQPDLTQNLKKNQRNLVLIKNK